MSDNNQNQTLSQQLTQQVAQKSYVKQLQEHADNTPHQILGALLDNWAAQGGTSAPNNVPQSSSPEMSADAAQSIVGGPSQNKGNVNSPGFVTGNNTVPGQQGGMSVSQDNNFDIGKVLKNLINNIQSPEDTSNTQGGMAIAKPSTTQVQNNSTTPVKNKSNSPLSNILGNKNSSNEDSSAIPQQNDINSQIDNINKQTALNIAKRNLTMSQPPNFWQRFGQNFAKQTGGVTQADTLSNFAAGQKIAAQEPLQPKDIGELNAGSYKAALEATGTALTATQQKLMAFTDLYGKEEQNKGIVASALKQESHNQGLLRQSITNTADNMVNHVKNFRTLIANRPTFNSQGLNVQTQDIVNKSQQSKVGKYTLVNSK